MTDELLEQFVLEGRDLVQQAFDDLLALERTGPDPDRIDRAFRAIHTLKGSAGLFDAAPLGAALHAAEDLMSALRNGSQVLSRAATEALLMCMGAVERWIDALATAGRLPDNAESRARDLVAALHAALAGGTLAGGAPLPPSTVAQAERPAWLHALLDRAPPDARTALRYVPSPDCFFLGDDPLALLRSVPNLLALEITGREAWVPEDFDPFRCNLVLEALSGAPEDDIRAVFRFVADQVVILPVPAMQPDATADAPPAADAGTRTLRIEVGRIDALADLVGELFVAKNRLAHLIAEVAAVAPGPARALAAAQTDIERLAADMHRAVMTARMTPLNQTFRRLDRLVRETAGQLGKAVHLSIEGTGTEADKTVADGLFEPLLHILRNAVDHGIESEAVRAAAGKPPIGQIALRAGREGEQVVITVSDDGAGLDPTGLREAARRRGLIATAALDLMDDDAALDLIFQPGFSTAASVTAVSGRGVGMDAVRAAVGAMGGHVSIAGAPGAGTTVRFIVPQAVAVTSILVVQVGEERFGLPLETIVEMARVARDAMVPVRAGRAFVLRDRTIPVLRLAHLLGRPTTSAGAEAKILVIAHQGQLIGLEVDGVGTRMEVVLRPLGGVLSSTAGVRGASLLGDGRVLLVLDVPGLVG